MILQITEITGKLLEYGLGGIVIMGVSYALYTIYNKLMTTIERVLTMYDLERAESKDAAEEYKEYLKSIIKDISVQLERSSDVIERHTLSNQKLVDFIDEHLGCSYNNDILKKK